jgi:hypothetical protein
VIFTVALFFGPSSKQRLGCGIAQNYNIFCPSSSCDGLAADCIAHNDTAVQQDSGVFSVSDFYMESDARIATVRLARAAV